MNTSLVDISRAIQKLEEPVHDTILIYGDSTSGKTTLAGTLAKVPWVEKIYWFDLENGFQTLVKMFQTGMLTEQEAAKIQLFRIPDSVESPVAYETMLKVFTRSSREWTICKLHGRADCHECTKNKAEMQGSFCLSKTTGKDFVVVDTGSQLGDSIMNYACRGEEQGYKPGWDEYGLQGRELSAFLSVVQTARYCNFAVLAQKLVAEYDAMGAVADKNTTVTKEKVYPLMGTKGFSSKCGKYFSHKIYTSIETKRHQAGSSSTYKLDVLTGSRSDWKVENVKELSMDKIYAYIQEEKEKAGTTTNK